MTASRIEAAVCIIGAAIIIVAALKPPGLRQVTSLLRRRFARTDTADAAFDSLPADVLSDEAIDRRFWHVLAEGGVRS